MAELRAAVLVFKMGRVAGPDLHPVEFRKGTLESGRCPVAAVVVQFCVGGEGGP